MAWNGREGSPPPTYRLNVIHLFVTIASSAPCLYAFVVLLMMRPTSIIILLVWNSLQACPFRMDDLDYSFACLQHIAYSFVGGVRVRIPYVCGCEFRFAGCFCFSFLRREREAICSWYVSVLRYQANTGSTVHAMRSEFKLSEHSHWALKPIDVISLRTCNERRLNGAPVGSGGLLQEYHI